MVATASGGEEGLDLARQLQPALITLDVMMPGLDGWAVLKELKSDPALQQIPVMMVTIEGDDELGYTLGAVEHLTKPVDREKLLQLVSHHAGPDGGGVALVVDDDDGMRSLFSRALSEDGWTVDVAENGAQALERASERRPDLVVLDLMMPVMDGFDFLFEFRLREDCTAVPVIVVTAKDLTEEDRQRLNGGVERIVEKGALTRPQLLARVREFVEKHGTSLDAEG